MIVGEIIVGEMIVDEIIVDEMIASQSNHGSYLQYTFGS